MIFRRTLNLLIFAALCSALAGCNMPAVPEIPGLREFIATPQPLSPAGQPISAALPPPAETLVSFSVQPPPGSPTDQALYLSILDEVTGLALNTRLLPLQAAGEVGGSTPVYQVSAPFAIGSLLKYRYERQAGPVRVAEHLSDGSAVRYRMLHVDAGSSVQDVISRWTDTAYAWQGGRIQGQAVDAASNQPIPNLLVSAGGAQTLTAADGSFMLEGLPPGVHNLVATALDGSYKAFQQGALVAQGATTPTPIKLEAASFVNIVFVVNMPTGTLPVVPLRMAGNLLQFGNTFAGLAGGISVLPTRMPTLSRLPDGRYTITAALPAGADLRYKYTLGDGFWNAEHDAEGRFRLRQLIVPDEPMMIQDQVESWSDSPADPPAPLTFSLSVPQDMPASDFVSIQFNPLIGWSEALPMWKMGENRWAYVLYSPLHLPGQFSYRYCRNGQCGLADDAQTPGVNAAGRALQPSDQPQTINDAVNAWAAWSGGASAVLPPVENVIGRGNGYWAGAALLPAYHPSWNTLLPQALQTIQTSGANWLLLSPTWGYGRSAPGNQLPLLEQIPGLDALYPDLALQIQASQAAGLQVALRPTPRFLIDPDEWWNSASRDESWWQVWFEQYRRFALHHADLAARTGAPALVLGGGWLAPALPGGVLVDGSPSGVPSDAEARWQNLIAETRLHYQGQLVWALPAQTIAAAPAFAGSFDRIILDLNVAPGQTVDGTLGDAVDHWMDVTLRAFSALAGKPLILSVACPSDPDLQAQVDCLQAALQAANNRDWLSGFICAGFHPATALRDASASVYGKPASELLGLWFPKLVK